MGRARCYLNMTPVETFNTEKAYYVLYAPLGFGEEKHMALLEYLLHDRFKAEMNYILMDIEKDRRIPLYPNYAFIRVVWSQKLEEALTDHAPMPVKILKCEVVRNGEKSSGNGKSNTTIQTVPLQISPEVVKYVENIIYQLEKDVEFKHEVLDFLKPGDIVRFRKGTLMGYIGTVIRFASRYLVIVETNFFDRTTNVSVDINTIEKI